MEKKSTSFAVIVVSIIALIAAVAAGVYFITRYLNRKKKDTYDFVNSWDDEDYDFLSDYDDCGCECDDCDCDECDEELE